MVLGLERRQVEGDVHFVTFSCYHRLPYMDSPVLRNLFEDVLQKCIGGINLTLSVTS